jgi:hypothetical protein
MRRHLTYANVMATIGVFLALGGASYAAIKLPANSVGSRQIKDGAIASADIKNHTIKPGDFKGGLPRGQQGPKGERGPAAAKYWARIGGGTTADVISSSGDITVSRLPNGNDQVTFPVDVSECATALTIAGGAPGRVIRRTTASSGRNIVVNRWIWTNITTGAVETTNDAFDIAVFC